MATTDKASTLTISEQTAEILTKITKLREPLPSPSPNQIDVNIESSFSKNTSGESVSGSGFLSSSSKLSPLTTSEVEVLPFKIGTEDIHRFRIPLGLDAFYAAVAKSYYPPYIQGQIDGMEFDSISFVSSLRSDLEYQIKSRLTSKEISVQSRFDELCDILNKTIYIMGASSRMVITAPTNLDKNRDVIVLHQGGFHTELIGGRRGGIFITLFENMDPLVLSLKETF